MRDISEIKIMRKQLSMTQSELANKAGVSQSLIAKIEAGKIDPAYSSIKKIFEFLEGVEKASELKAKDVMQHTIISINPSSKIKDIILKMNKGGISQMPVVQDGKCLGIVTDRTILESIMKKKVEKVSEIMDDCPPILSKETPISSISELLKTIPAVLIAEKGKIKGIITRADILSKLRT